MGEPGDRKSETEKLNERADSISQRMSRNKEEFDKFKAFADSNIKSLWEQSAFQHSEIQRLERLIKDLGNSKF